MIRNRLLLPLIVLYMSCLILSAWPQEIRPSTLDDAYFEINTMLDWVGIRAGIPVFPGTVEKMESLIRSRCVVVTGTDSKGVETQIYPVDPCPTEGFRWKPQAFDAMIDNWTTKISGTKTPFNLLAMGDYFCNLSPEREFRRVRIERVIGVADYETGQRSTETWLIGRVKCRS